MRAIHGRTLTRIVREWELHHGEGVVRRSPGGEVLAGGHGVDDILAGSQQRGGEGAGALRDDVGRLHDHAEVVVTALRVVSFSGEGYSVDAEARTEDASTHLYRAHVHLGMALR